MPRGAHSRTPGPPPRAFRLQVGLGPAGREYLQEQTRGGQAGRLTQHLPAAHSFGARVRSPGNAPPSSVVAKRERHGEARPLIGDLGAAEAEHERFWSFKRPA